MEKKKLTKLEKLEKIDRLSTTFFSRILLKKIYDFNQSNILDIIYKHCQAGFKDCLLSDIEGEIYLIYNSDGYYAEPIHPDYWKMLYNHIIQSEFFIEEYKESNKIYVFKFKFPKEYLNDFNLILEGKYSQLSKKYMEHYNEDSSLLYHLHNKTFEIKKIYSDKFKIPLKMLENVELGPKIDKNKETYKSFFGINI